MTGHYDFDRALAGWFEADALAPAPAAGLDRVLEVTRRRRPRPAWLAGLGSHWVAEPPHAGSSSGVRSLRPFGLRLSAAIVLLLVIAALVAGVILVGARLFQPSPLASGRLGHLAYGLDGDIFVADWDGGNPVRIADGPPGGKSGCGPAGYRSPIWSPNGRYLAYRSGLDQVSCPSIGTVNISDPDGHVMASFPGVGDALSWSPDSTRLATWLDWGNRTIGVYGLDGTREALLTLPAGFWTWRDEDAHWSPDGESLLISLRPDPGADPRQTWELPVDGRTPHPLPAGDPRSHWDATFSADGAHVAYVDEGSLVVAAGDGSRSATLVSQAVVSGEPPFWSLAWSRAADRIAFAATTGGQTNYGSVSDLRLVDVATGAVTSLRVGRGTDALDVIAYSPEGDWILFSRADASDARSVWVVRTDGSDARQLVTASDEGDWQWLSASSIR